MGRSVLMIAFHFPPAAMSSGHLRTVGFVRYLPNSGWDPIVLSARAMAYPMTAPITPGSIPDGCMVHRALAFDARRHFSIAGKYPGFLGLPDRWISWWPFAVSQAKHIIRRHRVRAIWSTYPIMTAHRIAYSLHRMTGLPWIADFRDPVGSAGDTPDSRSARSQRHWESTVLQAASRSVFTTPGTLHDYAARYPDLSAGRRLTVIPNGYDEGAFGDLPPFEPRQSGRPLVLVHSGLLYPRGRNPIPFLSALARLRDSGAINVDSVRVILRASRSEKEYSRDIQQLGLETMVSLLSSTSHHDALAEQVAADALLLFQGPEFNQQIPAKLYEYLRIGRPIFALTSPEGDTAAVLRDTGGAEIAPIEDVAEITARLGTFIRGLRSGRAPTADATAVRRYSRENGALLLAEQLNQVTW